MAGLAEEDGGALRGAARVPSMVGGVEPLRRTRTQVSRRGRGAVLEGVVASGRPFPSRLEKGAGGRRWGGVGRARWRLDFAEENDEPQCLLFLHSVRGRVVVAETVRGG
jgi:hypothetical protein